VEPPYPSLHELELLIEADSMNHVRKAANYRDTVLNRLEAMNLVAGTVFDCSEGYPLPDLLERNVVFEFDGLGADLQNLLMELLMAWVYEYRLANGHRDQGLNHVFFLDEGKQVFSVYKERQDAAGIPAIDRLTAKLREFGEGLLVADQEASKLTDSIKANTHTKVLLPTGDRKQFEAMTEAMHLTDRQAEVAQQLGTGEAIVQQGHRDPVPVDLDHIQVDKQVTDADLQRRQADNWQRLDHTERETTTAFDRAIGAGRSDDPTDVDIPDDPTEAEGIDLSDDADRLLKHVIDEPFNPLTERYETLFDRHRGNAAKNELVEQGVVVERSVAIDGGTRMLLQVPQQGRVYADQEVEVDVKQDGRGGIVHRFWQHRIADTFEAAGWTADTEVFDADVYVNLHTSELAVEVAMEATNREIKHIRDRLDGPFDAVWVVTRDETARDALEERLAESDVDADRLVVRTVSDFSGDELPL
jgi:hypothetical protein